MRSNAVHFTPNAIQFIHALLRGGGKESNKTDMIEPCMSFSFNGHLNLENKQVIYF